MMTPSAPGASSPALLTCPEAAAMLRLHPVTLRRMAREGRVDGAVRVGERWRFRPDCTVSSAVSAPGRTPRPAARRVRPIAPALEAAIAMHRPRAGR